MIDPRNKNRLLRFEYTHRYRHIEHMDTHFNTNLLITIAVMTGSQPEWRTVLVAGCLAAIIIQIGVRAKKKTPTNGEM